MILDKQTLFDKFVGEFQKDSRPVRQEDGTTEPIELAIWQVEYSSLLFAQLVEDIHIIVKAVKDEANKESKTD